jgi:hypothetical protein
VNASQAAEIKLPVRITVHINRTVKQGRQTISVTIFGGLDDRQRTEGAMLLRGLRNKR